MPTTVVVDEAELRVRDDVKLVADVYRPGGPGPWPTLLMRTPYDRRKAETMLYAHPGWYAEQGFAVVIQDVRGRFASEGEFDPWINEGLDGIDTIDWIIAQPWSDGIVGMYGFSYPGIAQLLAGAHGHPALRAIAPTLTPLRMREGMLFHGGAFALGFALGWALDLALDTARRRAPSLVHEVELAALDRGRQYAIRPIRNHPIAAGSDLVPYYLEWLAHERSDEYWARRAVEPSQIAAQPPALYVGGWHDMFITSTVEAFGLATGAQSTSSAGLLVGPWHHYPNMSSRFPSRPDNPRIIDDQQLSWFDQFLRGATPSEGAPRLYRTGGDRWETPTGWPLPTKTLRLHLRSDGRATSVFGSGRLTAEAPARFEPPDVFVYDPAYPVCAPDANAPGYPLLTPLGGADQREVEISNSVLVYTSTPFEVDTRVAGAPSVRLHAVSSAVDTDWVVTLCDVDPSGGSHNLTRGIVRARSLEDERPISDRLLAYDIALPPVYHEFGVGHKVRLQVTSSCFPAWEPNPNTGNPVGLDGAMEMVVARQAVVHEAAYPSWVDLPRQT